MGKSLWKTLKAAVEKFALKEKAEFEKFGAKYGPKFEALAKRFEATLVKEGKGLGKGLLLDILQEIIKIIIGGNDVEPMQRGIANGIKDLWQKLIDYLDTHGGKFGKAMANILKAYKVRIENMIKKVLSSGSEDLIKLIHEFWEDLVKIRRLIPLNAE